MHQGFIINITIPVEVPLGGVSRRKVASLLREPSSMLTQMLTSLLGLSVTSYVIADRPT
jgi:hypothetical protein